MASDASVVTAVEAVNIVIEGFFTYMREFNPDHTKPSGDGRVGLFNDLSNAPLGITGMDYQFSKP